MTVAIQILDICIALGWISLALNLGVLAYLILSRREEKQMGKSVCYQCENRHMHCHASCEAYKKERESRLKEYDRRVKTADTNAAHLAVTRKGIKEK